MLYFNYTDLISSLLDLRLIYWSWINLVSRWCIWS